jgi:hypothetical protein
MRKPIPLMLPAAALAVAVFPAHAARLTLSDFMAQCTANPSYCETANGNYIQNAARARSICLPKSVSQDQAQKDMMAWLRKEADKSKSVSLDTAQWDAINALWPCGADDGNNKV